MAGSHPTHARGTLLPHTTPHLLPYEQELEGEKRGVTSTWLGVLCVLFPQWDGQDLPMPPPLLDHRAGCTTEEPLRIRSLTSMITLTPPLLSPSAKHAWNYHPPPSLTCPHRPLLGQSLPGLWTHGTHTPQFSATRPRAPFSAHLGFPSWRGAYTRPAPFQAGGRRSTSPAPPGNQEAGAWRRACCTLAVAGLSRTCEASILLARRTV